MTVTITIDEHTRERDEMVVRYLPAVRALAIRVGRHVRAVEVDDLVGYGSIGLLRAIDTYDPTRGAKFWTWAFRKVHGAMIDGLRSCGLCTKAGIARMRAGDERGQVVLSGRGATIEERAAPGPDPETITSAREIAVLVRELPRKERALVVALASGERVTGRTAAGFGHSKSWGTRLRQRGVERVRVRALAVAA